MAHIDPADDTLGRYVVHHYRWDPERRQRRNVVVAVVDDEAQFKVLVEQVHRGIVARREAGDREALRENASGVFHAPGHLRRSRNGHQLRRAMEHGVSPTTGTGDDDLPGSMAVLSAEVGPEDPQ